MLGAAFPTAREESSSGPWLREYDSRLMSDATMLRCGQQAAWAAADYDVSGQNTSKGSTEFARVEVDVSLERKAAANLSLCARVLLEAWKKKIEAGGRPLWLKGVKHDEEDPRCSANQAIASPTLRGRSFAG